MIDASILSTLRHRQSTNLAAGKISNHDAALIILAASGGVASSAEITKHLQGWRHPAGTRIGRPLHFTYLWNRSGYGGYGFVGRNINSVSNTVHHHGTRGKRDCVTQRRTYWYRVKPGHYSITLEGLRRIAELKAQLEVA